MKKNINKFIIIALTIFVSIAISSCNKDDIENKRTLEKLYETYKNEK